MGNQTRVIDSLITVTSSERTLADKFLDIVSCVDFGASVTGTTAANTAAINAAIQAANAYVIIPPGISYSESFISFKDSITLLAYSDYGILTILTKDYGDSPLAKGGIAIKAVGQNGVLLRSVDFGVTAEPFLQVVDLTSGDIAALHTKFIELDEITAPANPSGNKSRMYTRDNGSGKTQVVVQFPTGAVQVLATEP